MPVGCLSSRHVESTLYLSTSSSSSSSNPAQENNHSQVNLVYSGCSKISVNVLYCFIFFHLVLIIFDVVLLHCPFLFYMIQTSNASIGGIQCSTAIFLVFLLLQPVAEFKEFERQFKFKPWLKYRFFHLKLYQIFQDLSPRLI